MEQEDIQALSRCALFSHMRALEIAELFAGLPHKVKEYPKNAVICLRGEKYNNLYVLLKGEIAGEIQDPRGKTVKVETLKAPTPVAAAILFAENNLLPVTMRVEKECRLLVLSKSVVINLCRRDEHFLLNLLADTGNKITFLAEKLRLSQFTTIREKIAGYILNQSDLQSSTVISLRESKETLSEIFGVSRPSLSRVFSELREEGILKGEGKRITITNMEKLESILKNTD